jgi:hypothetical protein
LTDEGQGQGAGVDNQQDDGRWVDWRSTLAITGINRSALAWAISGAQVQYSLTRPGHEGILMIHLEDVQALIAVTQAPRLRLVKDCG